MIRKWRLPPTALLVGILLGTSMPLTLACDLIIPKREPTVAEQMSGLSTIFGGTVIGWETDGGKLLVGSMPSACISKEYGVFDWESGSKPQCQVYGDVAAALFRVDTPIVGPEAGAILPVFMTWGDGDCNNDFNLGEHWFIAGYEMEGKINSNLHSNAAQQMLKEPIRPDEIAALRKMAAEARFDFDTLFK